MRKPLWMLNTEGKTINPAFTGNFFVYIQFPPALDNNNKNDIGFLASRVTLPNISISTITTGKSFGLKDTFPSSIDLGGQTLTITFFETHTYKVSRTIVYWLELLSNFQTGMPSYPFHQLKGTIHVVVANSLATLRWCLEEYGLSSFDLANMDYRDVNQSIDSVQDEVRIHPSWSKSYVYLRFERVFPTNINLDEYAADITATNIQMVTCTFSFSRLRIRYDIKESVDKTSK